MRSANAPVRIALALVLSLLAAAPAGAQARRPTPEPPPGLAAAPVVDAPTAAGGREDVVLPMPSFIRGTTAPEDVTLALKIFFLLTILTLAPSILMMATCYTRIVIVLSFVKRALATQDLPPNQVLFSLALFITFFVMAPTIGRMKEEAWDPYQRGEVTIAEAYDRGIEPLRDFMFANTRERDLATFIELSARPRPRSRAEVPTWILLPSFMLSEIHTAFVMGILIFLPFLVIDMVVASVLMSMGMIMLPPVMISLPFKILLFVLVDGWNLVATSILRSYGG